LSVDSSVKPRVSDGHLGGKPSQRIFLGTDRKMARTRKGEMKEEKTTRVKKQRRGLVEKLRHAALHPLRKNRVR